MALGEAHEHEESEMQSAPQSLFSLTRQKLGYLLVAAGAAITIAAPDLNALAVPLLVIGLILAFA